MGELYHVNYTSKKLFFKNEGEGVPIVAQWLTNLTRNHKVVCSRSLASLNGLRILHCRELWYRSQTQLRSGVAVALA